VLAFSLPLQELVQTAPVKKLSVLPMPRTGVRLPLKVDNNGRVVPALSSAAHHHEGIQGTGGIAPHNLVTCTRRLEVAATVTLMLKASVQGRKLGVLDSGKETSVVIPTRTKVIF